MPDSDDTICDDQIDYACVTVMEIGNILCDFIHAKHLVNHKRGPQVAQLCYSMSLGIIRDSRVFCRRRF